MSIARSGRTSLSSAGQRTAPVQGILCVYRLEPSTMSEKMLGAKENQKGSTLKHGYLLKQSEVLKQWHLRYFVLSKECLCYYRTEEESLENAPKEVIFFNDMSLYIDELPDKQTKYCLKLVKRSLSPSITARSYFLSCFSEHGEEMSGCHRSFKQKRSGWWSTQLRGWGTRNLQLKIWTLSLLILATAQCLLRLKKSFKNAAASFPLVDMEAQRILQTRNFLMILA